MTDPRRRDSLVSRSFLWLGGEVAELQGVLKLLEQFELLMHQVYDELHQAFSQDAEAAALFSRLAFDERSHLGKVQFLRRLTRQNSAHFADVELDFDALKQEVTQLEKIREAAPRLSLHEALVLAVEFESGVAEVHSRRAIASANPEVAHLLASLHEADQGHRETLLEFARKRGWKSV